MAVEDIGIGHYHILTFGKDISEAYEYIDELFGHLSEGKSPRVIELRRNSYRIKNITSDENGENNCYYNPNSRFLSISDIVLDEIKKTKRKKPLFLIVDNNTYDNLDLDLGRLYYRALEKDSALKRAA